MWLIAFFLAVSVAIAGLLSVYRWRDDADHSDWPREDWRSQ